jgi:hypothetical protein
VWEVASGKLAASLRPSAGAHVIAAAFDPLSRILASAGTDGRIQIWDILTQRSLECYEAGFPAAVSAMGWESQSLFGFSRDGHTLASTGGQSGVLIWDLHGVWERIMDLPRAGASSDAEEIWSRLASEDARAALSAVCDAVLTDESTWKEVVQHVESRYAPLSEGEHRMLDRLTERLASESFTTREQAAKELRSLRPGLLLELDRRKPTIADTEARWQIVSVLSELKTLDGAEGRTVERLRQIHQYTTPERREQLDEVLPSSRDKQP